MKLIYHEILLTRKHMLSIRNASLRLHGAITIAFLAVSRLCKIPAVI